MDYKEFAERTKDKSFDTLVHEGKKKTQQILEAQGMIAMALYISEMMARALEEARQEPFTTIIQELEYAVS